MVEANAEENKFNALDWLQMANNKSETNEQSMSGYLYPIVCILFSS